MTIKAYKERVFAEGFGEFVRTEPATGYNAPYIGYIKTTIGEATVPHSSKVLFEVLSGGDEITERVYKNAKLTVLNKI